MTDDTCRITFLTGAKRIQYRCMVKISHDGGETWWPPGPYEIHVAGETWVLLMDGRYERKLND